MKPTKVIHFEQAVHNCMLTLEKTVPRFLDYVISDIASGRWHLITEELERNPDNEPAQNSLRLAIVKAIDQGLEIPKSTYPHLKKILIDIAKPKTKLMGRPRKVGIFLEIGLMIRALQKRGMTATRNDASPATSACDAVAEAYRRLGRTPNTYDSVKAIWRVESKVPHRA